MKLLDRIRVLDMTNVLAGPFATLHLALAGAEVIKIENPEGGDLARKLGNVPELNQQMMGTSFLAQNSNKKSLTLNLKEAEGKEIFRKLVATADLLVGRIRDFYLDDRRRTGVGRIDGADVHRGACRCAPRTRRDPEHSAPARDDRLDLHLGQRQEGDDRGRPAVRGSRQAGGPASAADGRRG